eukprot:s4866_g4.t1
MMRNTKEDQRCGEHIPCEANQTHPSNQRENSLIKASVPPVPSVPSVLSAPRAMTSDDSLRDQLCQIEQSLGVCHVAEVQAWQKVKDTEKTAEIPMPDSALAGSLIRKDSDRKDRVPTLRTPERFGPQPQILQVPAPGPGPTGGPPGESHLGVAPPPLDAGLMTKLDAAVDQLIKGSVRRFTSEIIELGPATTATGATCATGGVGAGAVLKVAPRLPQQLAEIRQQLRQLSADCDRLQALAHLEDGNDDAIENMEAEHANTMCQANQLLDALNECEDPTE